MKKIKIKKIYQKFISSRRATLLIIGVVLLVACVIGGVVLHGHHIERTRLEQEFQNAKDEYVTALENANKNIALVQEKTREAEALLESEPDVEDQGTIDSLLALLDSITLAGCMKEVNTTEEYYAQAAKCRKFSKKWADNQLEAIKKAIEGINNSAQEKVDRLAREEEERKAAEAAQKQTAKNNTSSGNSSGYGPPQYVGLAAHARAYIGRTDMACDDVVHYAVADMGHDYYITTETTWHTGWTREVKRTYFHYIFPKVPPDQMQAGDILESPGHLEIYLGNGQSIHGGSGSNLLTVVVKKSSTNIMNVYRPFYL